MLHSNDRSQLGDQAMWSLLREPIPSIYTWDEHICCLLLDSFRILDDVAVMFSIKQCSNYVAVYLQNLLCYSN